MCGPYDLVLDVDGQLRTLSIQASGHQHAWRVARDRFSDQVRAVVYVGDEDIDLDSLMSSNSSAIAQQS